MHQDPLQKVQVCLGIFLIYFLSGWLLLINPLYLDLYNMFDNYVEDYGSPTLYAGISLFRTIDLGFQYSTFIDSDFLHGDAYTSEVELYLQNGLLVISLI